MNRTTPPPPEECAQCGASVPRRASACPECGADEHTGWRETSLYDGLDLPEESREDDGGEAAKVAARRSVGGLAWYWWVIGLMLLFTLGLGALGLIR